MEQNHLRTGVFPVMSSAVVTHAWVVPLEVHLENFRAEQGFLAQREAELTIVTVTCPYG